MGARNTLDTAPGADDLAAPPWLRLESTILAIANQLRTAYDRRFATVGLNLSQASILAYLDDFGPTIQTRLADHLGHGRASTGSSIDRLEQAGLVQRSHDPTDKRVWLVELTDAGQALVPAVAAIDAEFRSMFRAGLGRDERHVLGEALGRLDRNLRTDRVVSPAEHTEGSPCTKQSSSMPSAHPAAGATAV